MTTTTSAKTIIHTPDAPVTGFTDRNTPSPIVQAIRAGDLLFVSGQGPLDPVTREVVEGDIRAQTRRVFANLTAVLQAGGATFAQVVNLRVCLRQAEDFRAFNETFRELVAGEQVTRTCIVAMPHRAGVLVEIDCVAHLG